MIQFESWWSTISDAVVGLIGAIVALQFSREALASWVTVIRFVMTGSVIAFFMARAAVHFFHIDPGMAGSVAFIIGAVGGALLEAIIKAIRDSDLWNLFRTVVQARFGGDDK